MSTAPYTSLHFLQSLPPSLVNRDNNNAAKTILFGGSRRIRVSSQSWKRAAVLHMRANAIDGGAYSLNTTRFPALTAQQLADTHDRDLDEALAKTAAVFTAMGLKAKENGNTAVPIRASENLPARVAAAINEHWDDITDTTPDTVVDAATAALDITNEIDTALTGRMLAEVADKKVSGAVHVSHAFSVHPGAVESDFFTAVDDAALPGDPVASNLGETDLTAPLLYRSASIDRRQLATNLAAAGDQPDAADLARAAEAAFVRAFTESVPSAKKTSTNSATLPAVILAISGQAPESLADAFFTPVTGDTMLVDSVTRMFALADRRRRTIRAGDILTALVIDPDLVDVVAELPDVNIVDTLEEFIEAIR